MKKSIKIYGQFFITIAVSLLIVRILWRFVDPARLVATLQDLNWKYVPLLFLSFYTYQLFRLLRLELLAGQKFPRKKGILYFSIQSTVNATLPAGMGELSLVYLLRKFHGMDWHKGVGSVFLVRLWDLAVFALFFVVLLIFSRELVPENVVPFMKVLIALLLGVVVFFVIILSMYRSRVERLPESGLFNHIHHVLQHLYENRKPSTQLRLFVYTVLMWVIMYGFRVFTVRSLNFDLGLLPILWIYIVPIELLPVKGIANIGTFEATWFVILLFFGYSEDFAAILAFDAHVVIFSVRLIGAGLALLLLIMVNMGDRKKAGPKSNTPPAEVTTCG